MKTLMSLFAAAVLFAACNSDDNDGPAPAPNTNEKNELRLNDLRIGQSDRYALFTSLCGEANSFEYTGDTLFVEVIALNDGLGIREGFTEGSVSFSAAEPVSYPVIPKDNYLLLPERDASRLFFFFGNDTLPVGKPHDIALQQGECFIEYQSGDPFIGEEVGIVNPFEIGDLQYFDKKVVSCVPPFMDLDAYLVYDNRQLHMSMTLAAMIGPMSINGYTLIPKE